MGPIEERPPDPRCGETLDGRPPAELSTGRQVGRAALTVPRVATQAVLWPVVKATDVVEHYSLIGWMLAALTTDDGLVGVRPEVQYSTSFLPTAGARFFYRRLPGPGSEIMTRFRTAGPSVMFGQVGLRGPDWLGLSLLGTWNRRADRLFAGIGPNTRDDLANEGRGRARYFSDNLGAELRWTRRLPWHLVARAHTDVERRSYGATNVRGGPSVTELFGLPADTCVARGLPIPCVDEAQMPGFYGGRHVARAGGGIELDMRSPLRDRGGFSVGVDGTFTEGIAGDPSRHATTSAEIMGGVGGNDRLLLLRGRAVAVHRLGSVPIPFDELFLPSAKDDMRGFPDGRLRGQSGLVGSVEYRWYISALLDATLFVDMGTVADAWFSNLNWSLWFPSFGLGVRYYEAHGPHWEARARDGFQIAFAPDGGWRVMLSLASF